MVEPGRRSAQTALKIMNLAQEIGIKNHFAVVNKSRGARDIKQLQNILGDKLKIIAEIPWDPRFIEADLEGEPPIDFCPESPAVVFSSGMNKLVQNNIVDKLTREFDEFHIQADVVLARAAAPSCLLITNKYPVIGKPIVSGKLLEPSC